ncbi:MAG: ABC transporter ATP-binding protein [Anaerolineae bacterium]|nr:ABC transporter ATP-binding protein [Anaerolineae bacterium]MDW8070615.1 ABC transporter ATP-binding protein [Anaerolineae bacterium]
MSFLRLEHVHKRFGSTIAVQDFNLEVQMGEFVSLLGPSGCGKTTVLRIIAGFEQPTAGTVHLQDQDITHQPPNRRRMGMVFQHYALFPNMTAADNIGFGLRVTGVRREEIRQRVAALLNLVQMPDLGNRYPHQLSGGQQQRVALARALAIQPQVLLLDEPLSALDAQIRVELRGEIRRIQQQLGITTIYVTHDQEEAFSLSDRIVVMNHGCIEQVGTPFEIYNYPATSFVARFVGAVNQLRCEVLDPHRGQLRCGNQLVTMPGPLALQTGAIATIMIRPEALQLGERGGANRLAGQVCAITFRGPLVRVQLHLDNSESLVVDTLNTRQLQLPQIGDQQLISFAPESVWLVNGGG